MIITNPARFKPALIALVAGTFVLATGCSSSATSTEAAGGAAVSQLEAATGGSISGDCVSGSAEGASATVCADENGNASVAATVDDGSAASVIAASDDTANESTDTSTAAGGSATTTKPAAATGKCGAGFPLPSGTVVVTCSDEAGSVDLVATVPDPEGAYDFYLDALPEAGYTITDKQSANLAGVYGANITFTGGEFTGADTSIVLTDIGTGGLTVHLAR